MRILYLTHRLPYAPNRGDRIRAFHMLREMSRFADVSLFSLVHDDDEASRAADMPFVRRVQVCRVPRAGNLVRAAAALPSRRPLTHALLDAPAVRETLRALVADEPPDLVLAYCSGMARFAMEAPLDRFPFALDMVDVDSAKWARLGREHRGPLGWVYRREASTLGAFEVEAARRARITLVVNEREQDVLRQHAPDAATAVVSNGIDLGAFRPGQPSGPSSDVVFCGVMDYPPNERGVQWFVREVWPAVKAEKPDATFTIVGANPSRAVRALASTAPDVVVTGRVAEVQPFLWNAAVSVAPLQVAQGLQNKVLEALAAGLPVVATTPVGAGLPHAARRGCEIADDARTFARGVTSLLALSPADRRCRASEADLNGLAWPTQLASLRRAICGEPTAT